MKQVWEMWQVWEMVGGGGRWWAATRAQRLSSIKPAHCSEVGNLLSAHALPATQVVQAKLPRGVDSTLGLTLEV